MRNLKRVLSLALALVMVLGMMVIGTSAATYTDADEITYEEAIAVMSGVGLYEGNPDGSLKPTEVLTREQAATIITRLMLGKAIAATLAPTQQIFSDVAVDRWSAAAIEYCYNIGMIDGLGDGTFDPTGELTGTAFAKLLLCAMGYDADAEGYTGDKWAANINVDAMDNDLYIKGVNIADKLTREQAAQMILQAMPSKMVEYTTAFDKATGTYVLYGPDKLAKTFQKTYFKNLEKASGVITAVDGKGTSLTNALGTTKVSAKNVDWTDIGYAAYNWYLAGQKEDVSTWTSVSDVYITGVSLATSTEGLGMYYLTTEKLTPALANPYYVASVDPEDCTVYYNGVKVGAYGAATASYLEKAALVGCKVDFVDNDKQGKAESVVITEYTYDVVTGVNKYSYSGTVLDDYYTLKSGSAIVADDLANVDALAKGDHITYVEYGGKYYVNVLTPSIMELDSITRDELKWADVTYIVYELDGVDYIASGLDHTDIELVDNTNINEDIVVVLDEYGYIVYAAQYVDPNAYLYVLNNNHTDYLEGTTKTAVVFADGTAEYIYVSDVTTEENPDLGNGDIDKGIYSYVLDKDGNYVLTLVAKDATEDAEYETYDLYFGDQLLNKFTKVVDLRKDTFGTVYTGYAELPNLSGAKIVFYQDPITKAVLGFLTAGTNTEDLKADFVVFDTTFNKAQFAGYEFVNGERTPVYTYTLKTGVLVKGKLVTNYVLTQDQKDDIDANGVGAYTWGSDGELKKDASGNVIGYVPFTNGTITWTPENYGTLIKDNKDVTGEYTAVFVNIAKGEIGYWARPVAAGTYYCIYDEAVKTNKIVYIMTDKTVDSDLLAAEKAEWLAYVDTTNWNDAEKAAAKVYINAADEISDLTFDKIFGYAWAAAQEAAKTVTVKTVADLEAAMANSANNGKTIVLAEGSYVLTTPIKLAKVQDVTIIGDGNVTIVGNIAVSDTDSNKVISATLKNLKIVGNMTVGGPANSKVVLEGCTFTSSDDTQYLVYVDTGADVVIKDCVFSNADGRGLAVLEGSDWANVSVTGCNFTGLNKAVRSKFANLNGLNDTVVINGLIEDNTGLNTTNIQID